MERRINDYLTRLHQARIDVFDENNRKRAAPTEPTDGLDQAKRQRLGAEVPHTGQTPVPALPAGPVSAAQLFSLTDDKTRNFDVTQLNIDVIHQLLVPMLKAVDRRKFDNAINVRGCALMPSPETCHPTRCWVVLRLCVRVLAFEFCALRLFYRKHSELQYRLCTSLFHAYIAKRSLLPGMTVLQRGICIPRSTT